jgi:hypothetical protein
MSWAAPTDQYVNRANFFFISIRFQSISISKFINIQVSAFVGGFRKKVWLNHHSTPITALQTFPDGVITAAKGVVQFCNSKMEPTSQLSTGQVRLCQIPFQFLNQNHDSIAFC